MGVFKANARGGGGGGEAKGVGGGGGGVATVGRVLRSKKEVSYGSMLNQERVWKRMCRRQWRNWGGGRREIGVEAEAFIECQQWRKRRKVYVGGSDVNESGTIG